MRSQMPNRIKMMFWSDFAQLVRMVLLILGALLPVVNPLGDAPIFLRMTPGCDEATRVFLAGRIALYSFFFVLGSLMLGSFVLVVFGISIPVVQVAGGAMVCALAWKVLGDTPKTDDVKLDLEHAKLNAMGRAITPLTLPMTIDAGVIAVSITIGASHAQSFEHTVIQLLATLIGAAIIALSILLTYRYAHSISRRIGVTGTLVLVRLSAFIMLCIGVGICWDGIKALLAGIGVHA
jgi:multiple antibiotic resistance protein